MTEKLFHVREKGTSARTELLAGLTTFMTMASFDLLLGSATWADVMPMVVTLAAVFAR